MQGKEKSADKSQKKGFFQGVQAEFKKIIWTCLLYTSEHDDSHEDYITWLKILKKYGPAVGIDRPYLKYRLSEEGKSRNKLKSARMTYHVYRYVGYGPVKSTCFFISYALHGLWKYRKK